MILSTCCGQGTGVYITDQQNSLENQSRFLMKKKENMNCQPLLLWIIHFNTAILLCKCPPPTLTKFSSKKAWKKWNAHMENNTWLEFIEGTSTLRRQNALLNPALSNNHHAGDSFLEKQNTEFNLQQISLSTSPRT